MDKPLSESLAQMLAEPADAGGLTINSLLEQTEGRGMYLLVVALCLPFVVPFSIPGLSPIMGTIIAVLMLRLALRKALRLPRFLGERQLPPGLRRRVLGGGVICLRLLERVARPRRTPWLMWRPVHFANCLLIVFLAALLALPLPAPPFFLTNSVPSYGIIVLAASMMEEDGRLIWLGYALAIVNIVFFSLIGGAIAQLLMKGWHLVGQMTS